MNQENAPDMDLSPLPAVTALLPPAQVEFIVVADTHLVDTRAAHAGEFASRLRQNDRVATALRVAAGTGGGAAIHLGDLVQDYPESELHEDLLVLAVGQWRDAMERIVFAPGNTDIGDKPDPSSPAAVVTEEALQRFAKVTGACWTSMDLGPVRALVLAASLFNSGMPQEQEQWDWADDQLAAAAAEGRRLILIFHYPLFLTAPSDPGTGHYDSINQPARSRLTELIDRFEVEDVFTGHSHFGFFNRIGRARVHGAPSTSFTRPGFSELFSSAAPPDRGRDDVPKLGMLLVRVHPDGLRVHQVRTGELAERAMRVDAAGAVGSAGAVGPVPARPVVSAVPRDVPSSRLGVVLRHPVTNFAQVPDVFPSVVRESVRNDYPLLGLLELGARYASVSLADAVDPALAERLAVLRDEGVGVITRVVWPAGEDPALPAIGAPVDEVELVLLDRTVPTSAELAAVADAGWPLVWSTLVRKHRGTAELPRWRYGLTVDEALALDAALAAAGRSRDRVLVNGGEAGPSRGSGAGQSTVSGPAPTGAADPVAAVLDRVGSAQWACVSGADVVVPIGDVGALAGSFLAACAAGPGRFFVDGLTQLDRTLDVSDGLLDRAANPQPGFHVLRTLNSLLHGAEPARVERLADGFRVTRGSLRGEVVPAGSAALAKRADAGGVQLIDLAAGVALPAGSPVPKGPVLLLGLAGA